MEGDGQRNSTVVHPGSESQSNRPEGSIDESVQVPAGTDGGDLEPGRREEDRGRPLHGRYLSAGDRVSEKFSHSRRSDVEVVPLDDDGKVPAGGYGGKEEDGGPGKNTKGNKPREKVQAVPALHMFAFADPIDYVLIFFGLVAAIGVGASQPGISLLLGSMINAFGIYGKNAHQGVVTEKVDEIALKLLYVGIAAAVAGYGEVAFWLATGERQSSRIRTAYLRAILRQDVAFFDKETATGEVIARLSGDTLHIQAAIGEQVGKFFQFMGTFVVGYIIAFAKGWKLSLVIVASLPLLFAAGALGTKFIQQKNRRSLDAYAEAATVVEQVLGSIRTVASFSGEKKAVQDYDGALKKGYKVAVVQSFYAATGVGAIFLVLYSSYALALWYAGILVTKDGYKGGDALTIIFSVILGGLSLGQAAPALSAFQLGQQAAFRMFEVIERFPPIDSSSPDGASITDLKGNIDIHQVRFCYPTRPGVEIFSNFSLCIPSCSTAALVGASGSGKSTVIQLLERFYDPQEGRITLDGVDIKTLNVKWLRQQIGLVGQEPVLFQGSLKDNIAYGKEGATIEEIQAAAESANAAVFIGKFPEGYDTQVGEHGAHLSGGQKQRVAIARAILKNPRILLLDEATSALDSKSESVVQEALDRLMKERTTIVVAHRLSTIRHADLIAVVEGGSITEQGTHDELISNHDGSYYQLLQLQEVKGVEEPDVDIDDDEINLVAYQSSRGSSSRYSSRSFSFRGSLSGLSGKLDSNDVRAKIAQASQRGLVDRLIGRRPRGGHDIETGQVYLNKEQSIIRLVSLLGRAGKGLVVQGSLFAFLHGVSTPLFGLFISQAVSVYFDPDPHELRRKANFWAGMFLVLAVGVALVAPVKIFSLNVMGQKLVRSVRHKMFGKVLTQEIGWFDASENSSGAISARLSVDASLVQSLVGDMISVIVQNLATVGGALLIGFLANWQLTLVVFAIMPFIGIQGYVQIQRSKGFGAQAKAEYEGASQMACDAVRSIRTVASFCAEDKVVGAYEAECKTPMRNGIRQGFLTGFGLGFSQLAVYGAYALSFWYGSRLVEQGKATFSEVFRVFLAIALSATSIAQTVSLLPDLGKVGMAVDSIFAILDRNSSIDSSKTDGKTLPSVQGDVEFRHVKFRYPSRPDVLIFRKLSLVVPQGQTVALVGESGSGKSTVIALLERWYDPEAGSILLDNVDIKELRLKWLRQQMGLVSQEPVVFNDTIKANILYGRHDNATAASGVSQEELESAATAANAHKFISELPDGYNTMVGERGTQLSGGQKQRIAIARAIIKNPKVLLLDEATSALDAESERLVQEALDRVSKNRTTIVIAHRLSTIQDADMIAVVKHRSIVEKGRHEDLIAKPNGAYSRLANLGSSATRRATPPDQGQA